MEIIECNGWEKIELKNRLLRSEISNYSHHLTDDKCD